MCKNYSRIAYYFKSTPAVACMCRSFYLEVLHIYGRFLSQYNAWHLYAKMQPGNSHNFINPSEERK
jgi:hypothetical protein